jgi:short-chain Z-isoprenyl diphosphate synthase
MRLRAGMNALAVGLAEAPESSCATRVAAVGWNEVGRTPFLLRVLYYLYQRRLLAQISHSPMPRHIGIILDGNRRYAWKRRISDPREIYLLGARKLDDVLNWCSDLQIAAVTLWVLSAENLARPKEQISGILSAVEAKVSSLAIDPSIHRRRVRVRAVGRIDLLPESTKRAIDVAEKATTQYDSMTLTIAIAYGGREEICDAVRAMLCDKLSAGIALEEAISKVTPATIGRYLYTTGLPDPDLIIRTSGEIRLSGFLMWQSAYSEFYFSDVYWPALRKIDLLRAVRDFQRRKRRVGR